MASIACRTASREACKSLLNDKDGRGTRQQDRDLTTVTWQNPYGITPIDRLEFRGSEYFIRQQTFGSFNCASIPVVRSVKDLRNRHNLAERSHRNRVGGLRGVIVHFSELIERPFGHVLRWDVPLALRNDARHNFDDGPRNEAFDDKKASSRRHGRRSR